MAFNRKTGEYERYNPNTQVGSGPYSSEQKKQMIRDLGYTWFNKGFEKLTGSAFDDIFFREWPKGKMAVKTELADKYFSKGTGTGSPAPAEWGTDIWGGAAMADAYDKQSKEYVDAVRAGEQRTTSVGMEKFGRRQGALDLGLKRNREDYEKYTGRQQADYNRNLAASDKNFAKKLQAAASGYGVRGLLNSGLFRDNSSEMVSDQADVVGTYKLNFDRQKADLDTGMTRTEQDYATSTKELWTDKDNYAYDRQRAENLSVMEATAATDAVWNAQVEAGNRSQKRTASQAAMDQAYGAKTTPRRAPYRIGGKFTQ